MLKDTRFILVRAECPYVQFVVAARVISTEKFVVRVTNGRERDRSQVSGEMSERVLRELGCYLAVCSCCVLVGLRFDGFMMIRSGLAWIDPMCSNAPYGTSYFPFYRPRESMGYSGRRKRIRERAKDLQDRWVLPLLHAGPADPVDVNRDSFTL